MALHNGPQNSEKSFNDLKKYLYSQHITDFDTDEFKTTLSQLTVSIKALLKGGIQVNANEDILTKFDAIVLIFELSIAAESLPVGDKKRESIQSLQDKTLDEIIKSINNINQNAQRWGNPLQFEGLRLSYISAHQRLLMINSLLFHYARTLHKNVMIQNFPERFIHFPLSIEASILEKSKQAAKDRTSIPSATESKMIVCCLSDRMYGPTSQFNALKQHARQTYIQSDTGLELDFPLANNITIELDGDKFHFINRKPTLGHLRKEKQLLENGWIRISLSTSLLNKYEENMRSLITAVTTTLNSAPAGKYLEMHTHLTSLRSELRNEIKAVHHRLKESIGVVSVGQGVQLKAARQSQSKRKKQENLFFSESASSLNASAVKESPLSTRLKILLELENKISTFLGQNHLDKVLNKDALHDIIRSNLKLYGDINDLGLNNEKLRTQIKLEIGKIKALENRLHLNTSKKKSTCAEWKQKQHHIDNLKHEQADLLIKIGDCREKISVSEQELVTLLSQELRCEESISLNEAVSHVIHPSEMEAEESVYIDDIRPEESLSASSKLKA